MQQTKFFLGDYGSTHRIIELYGSVRELEYYSLRDEVVSIVPKSWKRQSSLKLNATDELIIGSGNNSLATDTAIKECNKVGAKATVLVDSWVNYPSRFSILPSEVLVTDPWARDYAKSSWPNVPVIMKLINRTQLSIKHLEIIKKVIIIGTPRNNYTEETLSRHSYGGDCLCPEIGLVEKAYKDCMIVLHPHPNVGRVCSLTRSEITNFDRQSELINEASPHSIMIGRPSYAHYIFESIGVPAYFSERVNTLWKGPLFRLFL